MHANIMDSIIPVNDKEKSIKPSRKMSVIKNNEIIKSNINKIIKEYFIILNA